MVWSISMIVLVIIVTLCTSALQLAAMKQWSGGWKKLAFFPLAVLLAWVALIVLSKAVDNTTHSLWAFEIFAWSMITLVYMVILITAKKAIAKAEAEEV